MILTRQKIIESVENGDIYISNFDKDRVNPNSYNYLLGQQIKIYEGKDKSDKNSFRTLTLPDEGFILQPGHMYLGVTDEVIGSHKYAMSLIGRSSIGRLGLFLQTSANLGHVTSSHKWTLELYACQPIKIYPKMPIGQVSFWCNEGKISCYGKNHALYNSPQESLTL
ncbi:deoxycytidine deaminase [Vibrio coralliilyticus]|uniref:dCTP deaminase n=1 Tax=Vibrio coralliilyticus TaxID=190893 RepID=UPI00155F70FB|nr:deoxycytidine deaminase [Vibrio coralliilyticus]NRF25480.1 deoxycytidine deaminase [Vibrio coralliilyticus]NRF79457.1 deoxycytidine deaminase [Vibrio coralliilyticus]